MVYSFTIKNKKIPKEAPRASFFFCKKRAFLLTQTGYDVRVGKSESGLELLVHSDDEIFEFLYVNFLDDSYERRYYLITAKNVETINTYKERYSDCNLFFSSRSGKEIFCLYSYDGNRWSEIWKTETR